MTNTETVRQWTALLDDEAQAFTLEQSPEKASNMLVLCSCVEAAVTTYLIKQKMEGVLHDRKENG